MFRVLLINPPRQHLVHLDTSRNIDLGEISVFPPIGLMYLAQALRQRSPEFEVHILDAVIGKLSYKQIVSKVSDFAPHLIGLTAFTFTFYDVWQTAREIKMAMPGIPIVVGGPHMYIFASETMTHSCFNYGVAGDGEEIFANLCEEIHKHKEITVSPGLFFRQGTTVRGIGTALVKDLDSVSFPAIDLINPFEYYSPIGKRSAVGAVCTSRGCPFCCTFCQVPRRLYRVRSIKNVIEEIHAYVEKGITDFFFFDDLFNVTKNRVIEFCEEVLRKNLKIGWMFRGRIDQIDDKMLRLARKAGCHTISVGIEDATDEGLKAIKKNITIKEAFEAVHSIRKSGIRCSTNWIIGFPHHRSLNDLHRLLNVAIKINADYAQFSILQCLPGSELYDQAVSEKGIDPEEWRRYVLNPVENFNPPIWEKYLIKNDLYSFYEYAYRRYYVRPRFILQEALRTRSWAEMAHKFNSFTTIFLNRPLTRRMCKRNFD